MSTYRGRVQILGWKVFDFVVEAETPDEAMGIIRKLGVVEEKQFGEVEIVQADVREIIK